MAYKEPLSKVFGIPYCAKDPIFPDQAQAEGSSAFDACETQEFGGVGCRYWGILVKLLGDRAFGPEGLRVWWCRSSVSVSGVGVL